MIDGASYRQYAADCMRQAQNQPDANDKTLVLNVALAWLRLAQQTESMVKDTLVMDEPAADAPAPQDMKPHEAARRDMSLQ